MFNMLFNFVATVTADPCTKHQFLGLVPWYQYLTVKQVNTGSTTICGVDSFNLIGINGGKSDLPLVALAVVDDLVRIAGMVAVGVVIYGGVQYATSQGNPEQTARAQSTIINALVGLIVAVIAVGVISFLGSKLS